MFGLYTGVGISVASVAASIISAKTPFRDETLFKVEIGSSGRIAGEIMMAGIAAGHLVTGYFAPSAFSSNLEGGYNLLAASGEILLASGLYALPAMGFSFPSVSYMLKGHHGFVQKALEVGIGGVLGSVGIDSGGDKTWLGVSLIIGMEAIDWASYAVPLGAAAYHVKSFFFPSSKEESDSASVVGGRVIKDLKPGDMVESKNSQGSNFIINIQNCNNCSFVENKSPDLKNDKYVNMDTVRQILEQFQNQAIEHANDNIACVGNSSISVGFAAEL